jgi:hypothetical protein
MAILPYNKVLPSRKSTALFRCNEKTAAAITVDTT